MVDPKCGTHDTCGARGVMSRRAVIGLIAVWLIGLLMGAASSHFFNLKRYGSDGRPPHAKMAETLTQRLHLDPQQQTAVQRTLEEMAKSMGQTRLELRPRFEEIRRKTNADIQAVLRPDQLPTFKQIEMEWEIKIKRRQERERF